MPANFEVALPVTDELGEGPWWSAADQVLWRVDILSHRVHRWDPASGTIRHWDLGGAVGFAVPSGEQSLVAGIGTEICEVDLATGDARPLAAATGPPGLRFNDGKADRQGRVWAGTMADGESPIGAFYRLDRGHRLTTVFEGITVSNGLGWSPDNQTMYYTDSGKRTIWAYDFDAAAGTLGNQRPFAVDEDCFPDGLTVDAEGGVWSAKWDGGRVVRYTPDGTISETIEAPVSRPTSCMFGGPDLDVLYVTTARVGLDSGELDATPAGSVLAVRPGVRGLAEAPARIPATD